ncbi:MAG: hypothetical protein BWZ02_00276 [Lentisphaerae bacterium ADurb.BinA184]|nr:MAG: hypothetical protein BWZ02_00276 [Lentisphaerae bacterium ADurb.BinA184]
MSPGLDGGRYRLVLSDRRHTQHRALYQFLGIDAEVIRQVRQWIRKGQGCSDAEGPS